MPFRKRQKLRLASSTPVFDVEMKTLENGAIVPQSVNQADKDMPKPELFDLGFQLKSGVNLQEVNSKVLGGSSVDVDSLFSSKENLKDNNEVNDEN